MSKWELRKRPSCLERRFEFENYELTRDFLDRLGDLSEAIGRFPDISFGKTYVNITLRPETDDDLAEPSEEDRNFANQINELLE